MYNFIMEMYILLVVHVTIYHINVVIMYNKLLNLLLLLVGVGDCQYMAKVCT